MVFAGWFGLCCVGRGSGGGRRGNPKKRKDNIIESKHRTSFVRWVHCSLILFLSVAFSSIITLLHSPSPTPTLPPLCHLLHKSCRPLSAVASSALKASCHCRVTIGEMRLVYERTHPPAIHSTHTPHTCASRMEVTLGPSAATAARSLARRAKSQLCGYIGY